MQPARGLCTYNRGLRVWCCFVDGSFDNPSGMPSFSTAIEYYNDRSVFPEAQDLTIHVPWEFC